MNCDEIIQMHDSWLTINSIVGCTNGCKYCFLQSTSDNLSRPNYKVSAPIAIDMLQSSKYYEPTIPVCLLPNTDPFLNKNNIEYTKELLSLILNNKLSNPIIIITKCLIPDDFCDYLEELKNKGIDIIIYLSYSGLGKEYEPFINHDNIKLNFHNLALKGIKTIHYFRPLVPANSNAKQIDNMLDFVNQYTNISVVSGLKVRADFIDKIDFWNNLKNFKEESLHSLGVWPESAYDYFKNYKHKQNVFQVNSCALACILNRPNIAIYNSDECNNCNHCPEKQRELCKAFKKNTNIDEKLKELLIKIGKYKEDLIIEKKEDIIIIKNSDLTVGDVSYLTFMLGKRITIDKKNNNDNYFNSIYTNSKNIIIK